ncbi:hypothetical protein A9K71_12910 [Mesorhizobium sp. WSM3873]|nr:hypothetical protein A9K71_12910 [Mesorhizobium sp. WSM3873]
MVFEPLYELARGPENLQKSGAWAYLVNRAEMPPEAIKPQKIEPLTTPEASYQHELTAQVCIGLLAP